MKIKIDIKTLIAVSLTLTFFVLAANSSAATIEFRQDALITVDGSSIGLTYTGMHDAELVESDANANYDLGSGGNQTNNPELRIDADLDNNGATNDAHHALMFFDNIFGNGPGQVAFGSTINSATLFFDIDNTGSDIELYELTTGFDEGSVTWNSIGGGLNATNLLNFGTPATTINGGGNFTNLDVTATVAAWAAGTRVNLGWGFLPTGNDAVDIDASELNPSFMSNRPMLTIDFTTPAPVPLPPSAALFLSALGFVYARQRKGA